MPETKLQYYIRRLTDALNTDTMQITHELILSEDAIKEIVGELMSYQQLIDALP